MEFIYLSNPFSDDKFISPLLILKIKLFRNKHRSLLNFLEFPIICKLYNLWKNQRGEILMHIFSNNNNGVVKVLSVRPGFVYVRSGNYAKLLSWRDRQVMINL